MARVAGIRGATSVAENSKEEIISSTKELLQNIVQLNNIDIKNIASVFFTATSDVNAAFPAAGAREMGWTEIALIDAVEIDVPGSMPGIIRVLMHVNVEDKDFMPNHVYMKEAYKLRPDLYEED